MHIYAPALQNTTPTVFDPVIPAPHPFEAHASDGQWGTKFRKIPTEWGPFNKHKYIRWWRPLHPVTLRFNPSLS